jgi:hypothetical protein
MLGLEPMLTVLQKLGLSTSSVPASGQPFDWLQTVGQAQRMLGLNVMVGFWVSQDVRNTSRNLMVVSDTPSILPTCTLGNHSSSVSVVTLLCAGQSGIWFLARASYFSFLQTVRTSSGVHLALYSVGTGGSFCGTQRPVHLCVIKRLTTNLHLVLQFRTSWAAPLLHLVPSLHGEGELKFFTTYIVESPLQIKVCNLHV